jgi:hypothetical protein
MIIACLVKEIQISTELRRYRFAHYSHDFFMIIIILLFVSRIIMNTGWEKSVWYHRTQWTTSSSRSLRPLFPGLKTAVPRLDPPHRSTVRYPAESPGVQIIVLGAG